MYKERDREQIQADCSKEENNRKQKKYVLKEMVMNSKIKLPLKKCMAGFLV